MLELNYLRENRDEAVERLSKRCNDSYPKLVDKAIDLDSKRRSLQVELDSLLAEQNLASKEIGNLMQSGNRDAAEGLKSRVATLKTKSQDLKQTQNDLEKELSDTLYQIPNAPNQAVPKGKSETDNEEIFTYGELPKLHANAVPHWELASKYNLIDFELGVKITGAGFPVYRGKGARLQRALITFFLDEANKAGYEEVIPPLVVNEASGYGTGQLPDKEGQMYYIKEDDFYLIPTSEVPLTNIYRDVILKEDEMPIKHTAYTPCFRREAGSYGKDVRGLNRLHQFDKVEIVQIAHPDQSYQILDKMIDHIKDLLEKLELPYRILRLCGGDLGFASAITYDFEVYSAAQDKWLEVSSVSNFETYQSNRLKCRFKNDEMKKTQLVHTLNGSALALPRILAAILENHQTEDGIQLPKILHDYTGFKTID
ncbi:serine--tRNA ligase [Cryomorpha ignava]|uniref:Serine--tRNA ligase n=1 Tax=Cryomorpha ignava TaxID=101383 RepID=A0A7K3WN45_9FLAO|nr:serine--tRNA ligase [Cryomorpha ignava]NEN22914.1 serine--tRNA ligase [Cryomorpha ignava]